MLRVAFVDQTGGESGGAQESFCLLLQHLSSDIDPRVIVFKDGAYAARLRGLGLRVEIMPIAEELQTVTREGASLRNAFRLPGAILRYASYLRSEKIDLVYTHTVKAHFIAAPAARLAGIPCVMHLRDILGGNGRRALRFIGRTCSREHIAISRAVAGAYNLPETTVVLNPIELGDYSRLPSKEEARRALGLPVDLPVVGIVGRINRWKGHDAFLRIAALANAPDAHFVIAGSAIFRDQDFLGELEGTVDELNLRGRVTFLPWTSDVRTVYSALDILCNCSIQEPFGRTVIEAAACGVPSICFRDAGVSEEITDTVNGFVVQTGDEAAFARALEQALVDPEQLARMSTAAKAFARRFAADAHAANVIHVLKKAVA
ncbi:MAG: glycosyltransferase [Candidatus Eremiobacteraeota bacterium]|nr:glycosyltransferase [Candidatus Eremiobacteraeota bacterium]